MQRSGGRDDLDDREEASWLSVKRRPPETDRSRRHPARGSLQHASASPQEMPGEDEASIGSVDKSVTGQEAPVS